MNIDYNLFFDTIHFSMVLDMTQVTGGSKMGIKDGFSHDFLNFTFFMGSNHNIFLSKLNLNKYEPRFEKPVFGISDQVRRKPGSTITQDG